MSENRLPGAGPFGLAQYELTKIAQEVGFGLLIVLLGASAKYFDDSVAPRIDQSTMLGFAGYGILRIAIEIVRRWLADNSPKK